MKQGINIFIASSKQAASETILTRVLISVQTLPIPLQMVS